MGDKTREPRAMGQLTVGSSEGDGGQPPQRPARSVPVGMERVFYAAAVDPVFLDELLADRVEAAQSRGFALTDSELAMLRVVPEVQLRTMVAGMDTSPENLERRSFMQLVAAGAVTMAAGEVVAGCSDDDDVSRDMAPASEGIRPDMGIRDGIVPDRPATQGIRPGPDSAGILPDMPSGVKGIQPDMPQGAKDATVVPDSGAGSYGIRPKG